METWKRAFLGSGLGLLLLATFLGVVTAGRVPLDHPLTGVVDADSSAPEGRVAWRAHIQRLDDALTLNDATAARQALRDAYTAALRSRSWKGLVEAGDASLRIGEATGALKAAEPQAREAYLRAIFRARAEGSIDGVLRAAEAFAALGDREVASQGIRIAEHLALDVQSRERVRTFSDLYDVSPPSR